MKMFTLPDGRELTIKTNNVPRPLLNFWGLEEKEQKAILEEHDLVLGPENEGNDPEEIQGYWFRYKGSLYALSEFNRISPPSRNDPNPWVFHVPEDHPWVTEGWQAANKDGLGMLIRFNKIFGIQEDTENIIVGISNTF